jgi:phosphatidate cytidylyltransferase
VFEGNPQAGLMRPLAWLFGFMACCSSVAELHPGLRGPTKASTRAAVHTWWPVVLTSVVMAFTPPWAGLALLGGLSLLALREWLRLLPTSARHPALDALAYLAVPLHLGVVAWRPAAPPLGWLAVWVSAALPAARLRLKGHEDFAAHSGRLALALLSLGLGLGSLGALLLDEPLPGLPARGPLSLLIFLTMTNDASQWLAGKTLGRRLLAPRLSPKKTWEGLAGGVVGTVGVGLWVAPQLVGWGPARTVAVAVGLSLLGLAGDLLMSAWKRDAGVKDSGQFLPGQGGLLDRLDSFLVTAPVFFYALGWLS